MPRAASPFLTSLALLVACSSGSGSKDEGAAEGESPKSAETPAKDCTLDEVATLAKSVGPMDARERRDTVAKQLGTVCKLPTAISEYIAAHTEADPEKKAAALPDVEAMRKAQAAICPGAAVVFKQASEVEGKERPGLIYDRCKLDKYDVIGRNEYTRLDGAPTIPFYAAKWLQEQDVPEDQAVALARALLLLDRRDYGHADIEIPTLTQTLRQVPDDAVMVYITSKSVEFEGKSYIAIGEDGKLDEAVRQGHLIGPLFDVLAETVDKGREIADASGKTYAGNVVIAAAADTPYDTWRSVVYTAERADLHEFALLARTAPLEFGVVPLAGDERTAVAPDERYFVTLDPKGFTTDLLADEPKHIGEGTDEAKWDFAALAKDAEAYKAAHADCKEAAVVPTETSTFGAILSTVAALRGTECDSSGKCLFERVRLVSGLPMMARNFDPDMMARNAGILGALSQDSGHFLASPYGGAFAIDEDSEDVWGGLTGAEVGEAFGVGGLGLVGEGGGGGTGEGTIGLGNVGLIGKGGGGGTGSGYGTGSGGSFGGSGKKVPKVRQAKAEVTGSMDKDIIRRIVRAHINEVRYCYNKELVKDPDVKGRVTITFTIAATGSVSDSEVASSTVGNEDLESCIAKAIKRWKFPKPPGGGNAVVTYPFVLEPG